MSRTKCSFSAKIGF